MLLTAMTRRIDDILAIEDPTKFAIALSNHVYGREGPGGFDGLSEAEQTVYCIDGLEREVNNGGFAQFFFNSAGDQARETVAALRRIGADHTARLVERAMAPFGPAGPSPSSDERAAQLEGIGDGATALWYELDDAFYEYKDDLTGLLRSYVRSRREQFAT
jgi:hypothetical protein